MPCTRRALLAGCLPLLACRVTPRGACVPTAGPPGGADAPVDALNAAAATIDGSLEAGLVAALDAALDRVHAASRAPGVSAAVAVTGRGRWSGQRGLAATSPATSLPPAARFQAASVGKLLTATVILREVERGGLGLRDRLARWFPDFPGSEHVTLDHLLRHTGGVHDFSADARDEDDNLRYRGPSALIAEAAAHPPAFCPGAAWQYCNTGYVMLGRIAEAAYGRPFAQILADEVVAPLGLRATEFVAPRTTPIVRGHDHGVVLPPTIDYATPFSAGGVASTADELVQVLHAVLAGRLLRPASARAMASRTQPMFGDANLRYGAGLMLYQAPGPGLMLGHSGGARGCRAIVAYLPADAAYVSVLFNDEAPAEAGLWALVQALRGAA